MQRLWCDSWKFRFYTSAALPAAAIHVQCLTANRLATKLFAHRQAPGVVNAAAVRLCSLVHSVPVIALQFQERNALVSFLGRTRY